MQGPDDLRDDSLGEKGTSQAVTKPAWSMVESGLLFTEAGRSNGSMHARILEETCSRGEISSGSTGGMQHVANDCIEQFSEQNLAVQCQRDCSFGEAGSHDVKGPVGGQSARRRIRGKQPAADSEKLPSVRCEVTAAPLDELRLEVGIGTSSQHGKSNRDSCSNDDCVGEAGECKRRRLHGTASNKRLSAESDAPSSKKPRRPG